jgi:pyruvate dehydrogenase E1 component alpha subunit
MAHTLDLETALDYYQQMTRIRAFEEVVHDLYTRAIMPGLAHLYSGQEAVAVGVCAALRQSDTITSTHRGHGHCLAKGATPDRMFAELLGKADGYCRGKGGSMHIADPESGNLGANAIVGGSAGIATGAAFAARQLGNGKVSICFFGEGALGQGLLYESMNLAGLWRLPVIYVCEQNQYNEYTHYSESTAGEIALRAQSFGIPVVEVDGQDVAAVHEAAAAVVEAARRGEGPAFLLCHTWRFHGHHVGDVDRTFYRSRDDEKQWRDQRDPISLLAARLTTDLGADPATLEEIDRAARAEVDAAAAAAVDAPYPPASEVSQHVYA